MEKKVEKLETKSNDLKKKSKKSGTTRQIQSIFKLNQFSQKTDLDATT